MDDAAMLVGIVLAFLIGGGVIVVVAALWQRTRVLEMMHRERLAMIEKGLTPPADAASGGQVGWDRQRDRRSGRLMSAGIVVVGLGLALGFMLAFAAGEEEVAFGVGGAVAVIGLALIVTAWAVPGDRAGGPPVA